MNTDGWVYTGPLGPEPVMGWVTTLWPTHKPQPMGYAIEHEQRRDDPLFLVKLAIYEAHSAANEAVRDACQVAADLGLVEYWHTNYGPQFMVRWANGVVEMHWRKR